MKKDVLKQRIWILVICLAALLIAISLFFIFLQDEEKSAAGEGIHYHLADYEENIFDNKAYMSFQRDLTYSAVGVEQIFSYERDYESASAECQFFLDYFHTVINGDYQSITDYYVDGYFDEPPKFTMQMIYEPYVLYHSVSTEVVDGEEVSLINFHVNYRIFKNNGTFRSGVSSNTAIPQIYQLLKQADGSYRIYRILDVKMEDEN